MHSFSYGLRNLSFIDSTQLSKHLLVANVVKSSESALSSGLFISDQLRINIGDGNIPNNIGEGPQLKYMISMKLLLSAILS
jgi:hypothetical protein